MQVKVAPEHPLVRSRLGGWSDGEHGLVSWTEQLGLWWFGVQLLAAWVPACDSHIYLPICVCTPLSSIYYAPRLARLC